MDGPAEPPALPQNPLAAAAPQLSHLKNQKFPSNPICRIQNVFLSKIKITSDPIAMEEEDNCLGSLLNSSHCTLVADSTLLVTPANTRLASDRRHSLIFTRTRGSGGGGSTIG